MPTRRLAAVGTAAATIALTLLLVVLTWADPRGVFTADIGVKRLQVRACIDTGCIVPYDAADLDPTQQLRPIQHPFAEPAGPDGYRTVYGNVVVRAGAAISSVVGGAGVLALPALALLALLALAAHLGPRLGLSRAVAVAAVGLGTPAWFYGGVLWEHAPAAALAVAAVALLWWLHEHAAPPTSAEARVQPTPEPGSGAPAGPDAHSRSHSGPRRLAAVVALGACAGLSVAVRPEALLVVGPLGAGLLLAAPRRTAAPLALAAVLAAAILGGIALLDPTLLPLEQAHANLMETGFTLSTWAAQRLEHGVQALAGVYPPVARPAASSFALPSFAPSAALAALWLVLLLPLRPLAPSHRLGATLRIGGMVASLALPLVFAGDCLAQPVGLLPTVPLAWLLTGRRPEAAPRWLHGATLVSLALALLLMPNAGGVQIGPRYLLALMPLLALLGAAHLRSLPLEDSDRPSGSTALTGPGSRPRTGRTWALAPVGILALGVVAQGIAFAHVIQADTLADEAAAIVEAAPVDAWATADGFVPCMLPSLVEHEPVYFLHSPAHPAPLIRVLRARDRRSLALIGMLPRTRPRGPVTLGPYALEAIVPFRMFPVMERAVWVFRLPVTGHP